MENYEPEDSPLMHTRKNKIVALSGLSNHDDDSDSLIDKNELPIAEQRMTSTIVTPNTFLSIETPKNEQMTKSLIKKRCETTSEHSFKPSSKKSVNFKDKN